MYAHDVRTCKCYTLRDTRVKSYVFIICITFYEAFVHY